MRSSMPIALAALVGAAVTGSHAPGACGDSRVWAFDLETEGADVFWTSPTAIGTGAARYEAGYELTSVEVDVSWLGIPFGPFDITGEIPPELLAGSGIFDGPLPITIFDTHLVFPEPPEPPSVEADVLIEIDAAGFGQASITNVFLGEIEFDLGPPFGTQTVTIESVRATGTVTVTELAPLGDIDGDCVIGFTDLLLLLSAWGPCAPGKPCPADLDGNGVVGLADLLPLLTNWGVY
jgi:hypothetical protein